ncbi:MAG: polysaccharide biosynthesis tyrosine autokinase [Oscillospiraceae bacterium]|nr:polysaccharide biosynthesis tyrosine autokinase [Oscillospiraceae bacterium]
MEETTKKKSSEFDFSVFWHNFTRTLPRLFWIPLLLCLAAGGFQYYRASRSYSPVYETIGVYRVSASGTGTMDINTYRYYLDANAAAKLAASYPYVMSSDKGKQVLREQYNTASLPSNISCRSEATLLIFSSRASTAKASYEGLEMAAAVFPQAGNDIHLGAFTLEAFDPPEYPSRPNNAPNYVSPAIKWSLMGLALGLAIVAVFAYFRKTVHNSEDLRELLNVPCLGLLPQVRFKARSKGNNAVLLTNAKLDEGFVEAIRAVRFQLRKELEGRETKVIMVTSTSPAEGKSTVSSNLALALAEQGSRVILVDCDLRKQGLKDLFDIPQETRGLVELIAAQDNNWKDALVQVEGSSLRLLSGDKVAEQPQNFLSSPRLQTIINGLREEADYVIVDTPPSGLLSDAASLSEWADGVIYVVRQDYVAKSAVPNSAYALNGMDVRFIGCVLNQTARTTSSTGYGYSGRKGSGYGYGYGYGYAYGNGYTRRKYGSKDGESTGNYQK